MFEKQRYVKDDSVFHPEQLKKCCLSLIQGTLGKAHFERENQDLSFGHAELGLSIRHPDRDVIKVLLIKKLRLKRGQVWRFKTGDHRCIDGRITKTMSVDREKKKLRTVPLALFYVYYTCYGSYFVLKIITLYKIKIDNYLNYRRL